MVNSAFLSYQNMCVETKSVTTVINGGRASKVCHARSEGRASTEWTQTTTSTGLLRAIRLKVRAFAIYIVRDSTAARRLVFDKVYPIPQERLLWLMSHG